MRVGVFGLFFKFKTSTYNTIPQQITYIKSKQC